MKMKVWVTKYALTQGLFEMNAEIIDRGARHVYAKGKTPTGHSLFTREWTKTREEAVAKAEKMKTARIASLKRSIKNMQDKTF
jgi:hypothetical protein